MMYQFFIYLYTFSVWVASLFSKKVRKMWRGEQQAFRILKEQTDPHARYIWFHAASLGEFEQGRPLIEQMRKEHPEYKILLTFFSPSGYEVRKNYKGADICCYLPLDTIGNARRFLRLIRPVMAFFIKYEFWYNYLHILNHRKVPTYSVSSIFRPNQVFFQWYGKNYKKVLNCFTHFYVQNTISKDLLAHIGIGQVSVVGDTRFDRVLQIKETGKRLPLIEAFIGSNDNNPSKVFVAGSSWEPDEDLIFRYFNVHKDRKLIIAPHVVSEDRLKDIASRLNRKIARYSEATTEIAEQADCLIIDCYGLLSSIYRYADVSYVGGGFGMGIHNLLEAAVWGCPVVFGPNNKQFQEALELIKAQGGYEIANYQQFADLMDCFDNDANFLSQSGRKAAQYVETRSGATQKIIASINGL